jgi:Zn-dependent peptidase ImmA (M78 family)
MADLAALAKISPASVSSYESAVRAPSPTTASRLAEALQYPLAFFYLPDIDLVEAEAVSFRALARIPAKKRDMVTGAIAHAQSVDRWITERYERPDVDVPDLSGVAPVEAAATVRSAWGLADGPLPSVIGLLESKGVRVYSLGTSSAPWDLDEVFGISMWRDGIPFIFINLNVTVERVRFSLLHELGHLVLHRADDPDTTRTEKQANTFAGHFGIPSSFLTAEFTPFDSFPDILESKKRIRASAMSYVYRLNEDGLIDEWRYRELCVRLRRDYGKDEPEPMVEKESSSLLRQVIDDLRPEGGGSYLAKELAIPESEIDDLFFGHVLTSVDGGMPRLTIV